MRRAMLATGASSGPRGPMRVMAHDGGVRIRGKWGNVARAAVATAALGLVVAWPRLGGDPPALPDDRAVPFSVASGAATPQPAVPDREADSTTTRPGAAGKGATRAAVERPARQRAG